jgi:hypothetical protein
MHRIAAIQVGKHKDIVSAKHGKKVAVAVLDETLPRNAGKGRMG